MHTCIHPSIHPYIHPCIHTYIHTHIHTYGLNTSAVTWDQHQPIPWGPELRKLLRTNFGPVWLNAASIVLWRVWWLQSLSHQIDFTTDEVYLASPLVMLMPYQERSCGSHAQAISGNTFATWVMVSVSPVCVHPKLDHSSPDQDRTWPHQGAISLRWFLALGTCSCVAHFRTSTEGGSLDLQPGCCGIHYQHK